MDEQVAAAMSRWPNVPAVFGWLSLSASGQWRLHPQGGGWAGARSPEHQHAAKPPASAAPDPVGEAITNPGILAFINRNYAGDDQGRWYFQNGPQRVFVRLDAAPFILRTAGAGALLQTHTGMAVLQVAAWWLDHEGRLFACTEHGPGLVAGRDTTAVFEALRTSQGQALLEVLEQIFPASEGIPSIAGDKARDRGGIGESAAGTSENKDGDTHPAQIIKSGRAAIMIAAPSASPTDGAAPLYFCNACEIPRKLGFLRFPGPDDRVRIRPGIRVE